MSDSSEWVDALGFSVDNPPPPGPCDYEAQRQDVLNERPIPDRECQYAWNVPPRVIARVVWERDGEESRETSATRWAEVGGETVVSVVFADRRRRGVEVWLGLDDVTPSDRT